MLEDLDTSERAEFDAAVSAAYRTPDGETRKHGEAIEFFLTSVLPDAVQAHRRWAGVIHDAAVRRGIAHIIQERWKALGGRFESNIGGKKRTRPTRRGVIVVDPATGKRAWTQLELFKDTAQDLKDKIAESAKRIEEERHNIGIFRRLLDLLEETGALTVERGLAARGLSLEEYLADSDEAAS